MSFVNVYIHIVWGTKRRLPILNRIGRHILFQHIRENAKAKNIHLDIINGHLDHVHCLVSLSPNQTLAEVVQQLKGESSFWTNRQTQNPFNQKLVWSRKYYAAGVNARCVDRVRDYIRYQELHHKTNSFEEEYQELMDDYGMSGFLD